MCIRVDMVGTNCYKVLTLWRNANGSILCQYFFDTTYFHLLLGLRSFQKSEFLKLIISFFHYFWCQNWDQWHKMSGKNTHIYFFYFWFKNKRVWAEKIRKKRKKIQKPKSCRQLPYHLIHISFSIFFMKNQNNQLLLLWLLRPRSKWK